MPLTVEDGLEQLLAKQSRQRTRTRCYRTTELVPALSLITDRAGRQADYNQGVLLV